MECDLSLDALTEKAKALGFDDVGVCAAKIPEADIRAYLDWLKQNYHGNLAYMENQMRCEPSELFPGARTAVIFLTHYKQEKLPFKSNAGVIASYARGRDYHNVHRSRLKKIIRWMEERTGQEGVARGFSDSAPVLEKALAVRAGLGWFGKNTLLIHRKFGTFTLLSGLFTSLDIPYTKNVADRLPRCGSCTRCLDACPTQAFVSPYNLDAAKCLSYHLIESKQPVPDAVQKQNPGYVFGCDICQDVCPHNVRPPLSLSEDFSQSKGFGGYLDLSGIEQIEEEPEKLHGTPLKRRGVQGLKDNLLSHLQNSGKTDF